MKPQKPQKTFLEIGTVRLVWLAIFVSVFSFLFYQRHGDVLLYGDAVAHINIARRLFDSRTPGLLQLGTVWLPLPHLLIAPFVISTKMWQSGTGGSIPSMAGFVLGVLGIFRLVQKSLTRDQEPDNSAQVGAWAAAILYAGNPNLIYMQATAMGESLYLGFFIWALVYFAEFVHGDERSTSSLTKCGLCLAAACWTRYDGWFLAAILVPGAVVTGVSLTRLQTDSAPKPLLPSLRTPLVRFVLLAALGPVLWLAYNAIIYKNPLEFANGPYSAKAIEQKTATVNPAKGNVITAGSYFLKAAELNVSETKWQERLWLILAVVGSLAAAIGVRSRSLLLLWVPLPFYALSVAYGSVPIFVPTWWPFSHYNVRYGLQLLPAFAVFVPLGVSFIVKSLSKFPQINVSWRRWENATTLLAVLVLSAASYAAIWRADPICYQEAAINNRGRRTLDTQVAEWIKSLPANTTLLIYLGEHVGALEQIGFPLRQTINEGNHRVWRQPADPEGLWERALADPATYADYAVGFEDDPVWKTALNHHLTALVVIHTTGQPRAAVFQGRVQVP